MHTKKSLSPRGQAGGFAASRSQPGKQTRRGQVSAASSQSQLYKQQITPLLELELDLQAEPLLRLLAQGQNPMPEVFRDLGYILERRGDHQEGRTWLKKWLNHLPSNANQRLAQAQKAEQLEMPELALQRYLDVLELEAMQIEALTCASELLMNRGRFAEALPLLYRRLDSEHHSADLLTRVSRCEFELGEIEKAATFANQALKLQRKQPVLQAIWSLKLQVQGDELQAFTLAQESLQLAMCTKYWELVNRIVVPIMLEQRYLKIAESCLAVAQAAEPKRIELHIQRAEVLLLQGRLYEGYVEYQWRLCTRTGLKHLYDMHTISTPQQHNSPCVLISEGPLGDTLLFSRYALWLKQTKGVDVRLYVQQPLHRFLSQCLGDTILVEPIGRLSQLPGDYILRLPSAPAIFGTCQEHPELARAHLQADPEAVKYWRSLISISPGERLIGINWHGSALQAVTETHKSDIPLETFQPLAELSNTKLVSLQKGIGTEQMAYCGFRNSFVDAQPAITRELRVEHTAAIMSLCDWIVTDDSGPAHLASCMGVPTIVLLPPRCNWRWGSNENKSPWYPNTTLLRQKPGEGWLPLVQQACYLISNDTKLNQTTTLDSHSLRTYCDDSAAQV